MFLGDYDWGRGVFDLLILGYKRVIWLICWFVFEFEDEEEGLLLVVMLFFFVLCDLLCYLGL